MTYKHNIAVLVYVDVEGDYNEDQAAILAEDFVDTMIDHCGDMVYDYEGVTEVSL